jgi:hypothetical protein
MILRAVDKDDEYIKKALDSLPSRLLFIIAGSKSWDKRKGKYSKEEDKEVKGEVRY